MGLPWSGRNKWVRTFCFFLPYVNVTTNSSLENLRNSCLSTNSNSHCTEWSIFTLYLYTSPRNLTVFSPGFDDDVSKTSDTAFSVDSKMIFLTTNFVSLYPKFYLPWGWKPDCLSFQWKQTVFLTSFLRLLAHRTLGRVKMPITSTHFSTLFILRNRPKYIVLFFRTFWLKFHFIFWLCKTGKVVILWSITEQWREIGSILHWRHKLYLHRCLNAKQSVTSNPLSNPFPVITRFFVKVWPLFPSFQAEKSEIALKSL